MKKVIFFTMLCGLFFIAAGTAVSAQNSNDALFDSGKRYRLTSQFLGAGKSLDVSNDNSNLVILGDTGNFSGQAWRIEKLSNGFYRLTTEFRGRNLSLDVINDGKNNRLALGKTGDFSGQFWKIQKLNNGAYRLTTAFQGDGKSLDVVNDGQKRNVQLAQTGDFSGQFWVITEIGSNSAPAAEEEEAEEAENTDSPLIEGFTGPTTTGELTVTLPFAGAQKLTVEVAGDGTIIFQRDMILGNVSDFARIDSLSFDAYARMHSNPFIPNFVKAGFKASDFKGSAGSKSAVNSRIWANSTIPYVLPAGHPKRDIILAGINEINSKTNLCLVSRTNETDYVEFVSKNGHWATLGRAGGRQEISIANNSYVPVGTVAHEIMHAAGFNHMQSREYRDNYVTINFGNIIPGMQHNFQRVLDKATNIGPYDFTSIMHYPATAFAKRRGQRTIDIKGSGDVSKMGQRDALASGDITAIATIYAPGSCKPGGKKPTLQPTPAPQPTPQSTPAPLPTPQPNKTPVTTTDNTGNIAIGKKAYQGTGFNPQNGSDADKAIDGNTDGRFSASSVTNTGEGAYVWWEVDLGAVYDVSKIVIWNRTDECCRDWQQDFLVATGTNEINSRTSGGGTVGRANSYRTITSAMSNRYGRNINHIGPFSPWSANTTNFTVPVNRHARYIRIFRSRVQIGAGAPLPGLSLAEVQVFGTPVPASKRIR